METHDLERAKRNVALREQRERLMADAALMNQGFLNATNREVLQVYSNQRELDKEVKMLRKETTDFVKETTKWVTMFQDFNKGMEKVGDVETWAKGIQMDLKMINDSLQYVCETEKQTD